jgi:hypothetical protein
VQLEIDLKRRWRSVDGRLQERQWWDPALAASSIFSPEIHAQGRHVGDVRFNDLVIRRLDARAASRW